MAQACAVEKRFHYKRHEPEKTLLYATLAREWETWLEQRNADTSRSPLPAYVNREMDAFFRCGVLDHGFVLVSCDACGENLPVAFSCKRRGFCPSCCAKRMSEISTHLVDNVLPHAPYRQWVTTFPYVSLSRKLRGFWSDNSGQLPVSGLNRRVVPIVAWRTDLESIVKVPIQ